MAVRIVTECPLPWYHLKKGGHMYAVIYLGVGILTVFLFLLFNMDEIVHLDEVELIKEYSIEFSEYIFFVPFVLFYLIFYIVDGLVYKERRGSGGSFKDILSLILLMVILPFTIMFFNKRLVKLVEGRYNG